MNLRQTELARTLNQSRKAEVLGKALPTIAEEPTLEQTEALNKSQGEGAEHPGLKLSHAEHPLHKMHQFLESKELGINRLHTHSETGEPHAVHTEFRPDLAPHHEAEIKKHAESLGLHVKKTKAVFSRTKYASHKPTKSFEFSTPASK